jgi:ATP:ADP antiporter, AAA family
MSSQSPPAFGKWRSFFWPVYAHEIKILLPMLGMFFLITFNYNLLRIAKDALVVTARSSGADAIPYLKTWAILPMAFLMTFVFTRFSNKFKLERVFYLMMSLFLGFFALFAFVLYPIHEYLHPHGLADRLEQVLPLGCHGLVAVFRNWTFTAFYVMSELWGTAIMTVLFWGFANQITSVDAAKRFYSLLSIGGNASSIFSGTLSTLIATWGVQLGRSFGLDAWGNSVVLLTGFVLLTGMLTIALFRYVNVHALKTSSSSSFNYDQEKSEVKMGLRKNFAYLLKSPYLLCIAVIVLTYNIAINLTEVVWKDQLRLLCPDPNDYQTHMGKVSVGIGVTATIIALFSGAILRRFKWTFGALIPPFILLITGTAFFSFLLFKDLGFESFALLLGTTPLAMGVICGSIQNCFSRASKYTLFDTTKELAFIPLNQESKLKGKAAIDGIGSRLGKSGSAVIYFFLLIPLGTVSASIPYVALILLLVVIGWIIAVRSLGKQFENTMAEKEDLSIADAAAPQKVKQEVLT